MNAAPLVVIGASGTGRETLDIVDALVSRGADLPLLGVLDDDPSQVHLSRLSERGVPYLGGLDQWLTDIKAPHRFVVAIASPIIRRKLASRLEASGHQATTLVHPQALIGSQVRLGGGTIVYGGVQISTNVTAGRHTIVNMNACVGHDTVLGDYVAINPAAALSGDVMVEDGVLIGGGATVLQGLRVGSGSTIGAKALVTKDVPQHVVVKGVPGRW